MFTLPPKPNLIFASLLLLVHTACLPSPSQPSSNSNSSSHLQPHKPPSHLDASKVKSLFEPIIGSYVLESYKKKIKSEAIVEYKGTYKSKSGEIKVVVTDWLEHLATNWSPKKWSTQIESSGQSIAGFPALSDTNDDKQSILVMVSKRVRVECKSKSVAGADLKSFAKQIPYSIINELTQNRGD